MMQRLDPKNDNILDNIRTKDRVVFANDSTTYVFQNRQGNERSETGGNYWFRPEGSDKGFTIPKPLFAAMTVVSWEREPQKTRYQVEITVVETRKVKRWIDANGPDELRSIVHAKEPNAADFEVLQAGMPHPGYPGSSDKLIPYDRQL